MSSSTHVLVAEASLVPGGLRVFAQDVASGMASATRFVVTFAGCASLAAVAVAVGDPRLRETVMQQVEGIAASLVAKEAVAQPATLMPAGVTPPPTSTAKSRADPAQRHVVAYLARRYRVADGALRPVVAAAYESGREL